jgi:S1-C subfamily serine protease
MKKLVFLLAVVFVTSAFTVQKGCKRNAAKSANAAGQSNGNIAGKSNDNSAADSKPPNWKKGDDLTAKQIARLALPAVVLILCGDGAVVEQGSGFFIEADVIVTNFHVVENAALRGDTVRVEFRDAKGDVQSGIAQLTAYEEESDLAVLTVPAAKEAGVKTLTLAGADEAVEVGETVYALGNPQGLVGTFAPGVVAAQLRSDEKSARLQITAPISRGSSGGPIVNGQGKVVAVTVSTMPDGQNLNFGVPANLVHSLIKTATISDAPPAKKTLSVASGKNTKESK